MQGIEVRCVWKREKGRETNIYNFCYLAGNNMFVTIHNKGGKSNPTNFRPIYLLPIISKALNIINDDIYSAFNLETAIRIPQQ